MDHGVVIAGLVHDKKVLCRLMPGNVLLPIERNMINVAKSKFDEQASLFKRGLTTQY